MGPPVIDLGSLGTLNLVVDLGPAQARTQPPNSGRAPSPHPSPPLPNSRASAAPLPRLRRVDADAVRARRGRRRKADSEEVLLRGAAGSAELCPAVGLHKRCHGLGRSGGRGEVCCLRWGPDTTGGSKAWSPWVRGEDNEPSGHDRVTTRCAHLDQARPSGPPKATKISMFTIPTSGLLCNLNHPNPTTERHRHPEVAAPCSDSVQHWSTPHSLMRGI